MLWWGILVFPFSFFDDVKLLGWRLQLHKNMNTTVLANLGAKPDKAQQKFIVSCIYSCQILHRFNFRHSNKLGV